MSGQEARTPESGGVSIDDFVHLKVEELYTWCYQEGQKTGFFLEDVQTRLPKYYEAFMDQLWKMAPDLEQGNYRGIEEKAARAKKLFTRATDRLKELKRTQG